MASAQSVTDLQALRDALTPKVIKTSNVDSLATTDVKVKGQGAPVVKKARVLVDEKKQNIQGALKDEKLSIPKEFYHKSKGIKLSADETNEKIKELESVDKNDKKDAREFRGLQTGLQGTYTEKIIFNAIRSSKPKGRFCHIMNIEYNHVEKIIKKGLKGGEMDSLKIRADLHVQYIEIKSKLDSKVVEKSTEQLEKGEACIREVTASFPATAPELTLHPFIYFGRKELKAEIDSKLPGLEKEFVERFLCKEDLERIANDDLLPKYGTLYQDDYEQLVSIFYCAHLLQPMEEITLKESCKLLVEKDGLMAGGPDEPTPMDLRSKKYGDVKGLPLSANDAIMFWTPHQINLILDFVSKWILFGGPYGSGKTLILRAILKELLNNPNDKKNVNVFYISGLEWSKDGAQVESTVYMLDILSEATTAHHIQTELGTTEEKFWELVPKFIQKKMLDTPTRDLFFLIDEAPLPRDGREKPHQEEWNKNWKTIANDARVQIRMAFRPDSYHEFREMKNDNNLGGFKPVVLDKIMRNTELVCEVAMAVADNDYNFPVDQARTNSVGGLRPLLYLVEEEEHRINVGAMTAFTESEEDLKCGVIFCRDEKEVLATSGKLGSDKFFPFLGKRGEGTSAYEALKDFYNDQKGKILITTALCFSGMEAPCVMATHLDVSLGTTFDSQVSYRAVAKLILIASRYEAGNMDEKGYLVKWNLKDAHKRTDIQTLSDFDSKRMKDNLQERDQEEKILKEISGQKLKVQAIHQQKVKDYTWKCEKQSLIELEKFQEIHQKIMEAQNLQQKMVADINKELRNQKETDGLVKDFEQEMCNVQEMITEIIRYQELKEEEIILQELKIQQKKTQAENLKLQQNENPSSDLQQHLKKEAEYLHVLIMQMHAMKIKLVELKIKLQKLKIHSQEQSIQQMTTEIQLMPHHDRANPAIELKQKIEKEQEMKVHLQELKILWQELELHLQELKITEKITQIEHLQELHSESPTPDLQQQIEKEEKNLLEMKKYIPKLNMQMQGLKIHLQESKVKRQELKIHSQEQSIQQMTTEIQFMQQHERESSTKELQQKIVEEQEMKVHLQELEIHLQELKITENNTQIEHLKELHSESPTPELQQQIEKMERNLLEM